ncbi:MAG TPA: TraB/GumN family protein [Alphaproteobacteria bacterium]|nr:TraB/GumN family protein [Alphaproteobacteria bacterium]
MSMTARAWRAAALLLLVLLPQQLAAESLRNGQGVLWQVARGGKPVAHVFGTIHLADPEIIALPAPVAAAFQAASSLSVEAILDDAASRTLAQAMALPAERNLQDLVPADVFHRAAAAAQPYGLQPVHLNRLKPWALALLITVTPDEIVRRSAGRQALDVWLTQQARAAGKTVRGLETMEEQIAVFDSLPEAEQAAFLSGAAIDIAQKQQLMAEMKEAYLRRDIAGVRQAAQKGTTERDRAAADKLEHAMIDERNRRMVERMQASFDGSAFVAVGALHLPGENGVLALLERAGYSVTRVY